MPTGKLSVQTENILPIIKKWLYSEKEIFLRELVSNALDAIQKLRKLSLSEDIRDPDDQDFKIALTLDKDAKVLQIDDNGVGMTATEIEKYIAQIAFSGAEDFVKKYEESGDKQKAGIIGNFGLGFYSAFMVSSKVEIDSLSWQADAEAASWSSQGGEEYEYGPGTRTSRGTTIKLHLDDESLEYLEAERVREMVRRYCDFLPVSILVEGEQANKENALWARQPSSLKKEDYLEFYRHLYPMQGDPLFHIHLNVDHPFQLRGVLFFPHLSHEMDLNKSNVKIFCKQVFVSDEAQDLIPQFLTVLQGVLDLPDLPLNVSRSYLQNEPQVRKIAQHIVKKVADRLVEEYKKNREEFDRIWHDIAPFIKYGMMNDQSFYDKVQPILVYRTASVAGDGAVKTLSLEDYLGEYRDKTNGKIYYATDIKAQAGPLKLLEKEGIPALLMDSMIDTHFMQYLESKNPDYKFARVDAEISDHVMDTNSDSKLVDADGQHVDDKVQELFKQALADTAVLGEAAEKVTIRVEALKDAAMPAMIILPEQMRRFSEMTSMMGGQKTDIPFPAEHTLLLNSKNAIVQALAKPAIVGGDGEDKKALLAREVYYLARLAQGGISADDLHKLLDNSYELLGKLA